MLLLGYSATRRTLIPLLDPVHAILRWLAYLLAQEVSWRPPRCSSLKTTRTFALR